MIELMKLPFKESALAPYVSEETVQFHYGNTIRPMWIKSTN